MANKNNIDSVFADIANSIRAKKGTANPIQPINMAEEIDDIVTGITPSGKIEITNTEEINVTNYATAQIVDSNLTEENIKEGVSILGKVGTFKGGSSESTLKKLLDAKKSAIYLFSGYRGTSIDGFINYSDTENVTDMKYMFSQNIYLKTIPILDTNKVTDMVQMFYQCEQLQSIPQLDTRNVVYMSMMCYWCYKLETISSLNMINVRSAGSMFTNCSKLTNLTLLNIKVDLQIGSGTDWGHLLTLESLINTIKELVNVGASKTLTMGSANLEKIANVYVKRTTTGDIPTCLSDNSNIDLAKAPCEVCESTDEGAMTLEDYANLKGWALA